MSLMVLTVSAASAARQPVYMEDNARMKKSMVASLGSLILMPALFAAEAEKLEPKKSGPEFDAGMDFRFRYEYKDNWMEKGKTSIDTTYDDQARLRTRVWGKADFAEDLGAYLRLGN